MKKIIFNCLPPFTTYFPNPAFSVLKSFLNKHGYEVEIIYWNILLNDIAKEIRSNITLNKNIEYDIFDLIPFFKLFNKNYNDTVVEKNIMLFLNRIFPLFHEIENLVWNGDFIDFLSKDIENKITATLKNINFVNVLLFGFSARYYQWIAGYVLAKILKKSFINTNINIIIGGFNSVEEAVINFNKLNCCDFAIWGEAENSLLLLLKQIDSQSNIDLSLVPNLVYKINNEILISKSVNKKAININNLTNNFDDYIEQVKGNTTRKNLKLIIETGRGCSWNKCNFCFLNKGFYFRKKKVNFIIKELDFLIKKHKIYDFEIIDNDVVGKDIKSFNTLLNSLIKFNQRINSKLNIISAEVNTIFLNKSTINKMKLAGFKSIQVGLESLSDNLLKKINKQSRFANHILTIKFCFENDITIVAANIIKNLVGEENVDIYECINNLRYLRFYLNKNFFCPELTLLSISSLSRNFNSFSEREKEDWNENYLTPFLPKDFIFDKNRFTIFNFKKSNYNFLWDYYEEIQNNYLKTQYKYKIYKFKKEIYFEEYCGETLIKKIKFIKLYWNILVSANDFVTNINELYENLKRKKVVASINEIIKAIENIQKHYLIYTNFDNSNIVTIINTDNVKYL